MPGACTTATVRGPDGAGTPSPGRCTNGAGLAGSGATSPAFDYDDTPPNVTGTPADRGPDHNGWYTHPVTFNFLGTDATSGIAACSHLTYGGPDDGTASLKGSCTDGAGNVTNKTIAFKYDATPPDRAKLYVVPANKSIDISWAPPSDGATFSLTRTPVSGGAATLVYAGGAHDFVDRAC